MRERPLIIVLISVHGLVRGQNLELGRDADTGGQVKYVVELARALGQRNDVGRVVLLTRRVVDPQVSCDYVQQVEPLSEKAAIVRIECGEAKYLRKELLWDCLETFVDNAYDYLRTLTRAPDLIHGHYADAGYVGARLSHRLGIPLVFTGHSLGRNKRSQLIASGVPRKEIETTYNISRRIEAEETTLSVAQRIITSTQQEIENQYGLYDFYQPDLMRVIPPGVDLTSFFPPCGDEDSSPIVAELKRFLTSPHKPMILSIARPDPKKNLVSLLTAYGQSPTLQDLANLVLVAGNRDDIREMEAVPRNALSELLLAIDRYDLYGKVAYPKHHRPEDVPCLLRLATASEGVFVNPALTEPFGLTLIEAAASGLPIVATEDGGPSDIIANLQNGQLVDPLDTSAIAQSLMDVLTNKRRWHEYSTSGIERVKQYYSWQSHVEHYLSEMRPVVDQSTPLKKAKRSRRQGVYRDQAVFTSLDLNLIGHAASLTTLLRILRSNHQVVVFGIATGRRFENALATLRQNRIPVPDVLITGQGTEIHLAPGLTNDDAWSRHIDHRWTPQAARRALRDVPGLTPQPKGQQSEFQLSYYIDTSVVSVQDVRQLLMRNEVVANVVQSFGQFLDVLPVRASKGLALRWVAEQLEFPLERTLVSGVTGADADMLLGNTLGIVVDSRHRDELSQLSGSENVFFSDTENAAGIIEAMSYYGFPQLAEQRDEQTIALH